MVLDNGSFWVPEGFQLEVVDDLFSGVPELWLVVPEGNGKALDVATPLPTPDGWTTMGAVKVGDNLLGVDGESVRVTFATEEQVDRECFAVRFSDGAEMVADADHLWEVEDAANCYKRVVRSTRQLLAAGVKVERRAGAWCSARWRVRTAARGGEARALPVDPYVLGVWLGDGATACGRITSVDEEVWERIRGAGYELGGVAQVDRARTQTVLGLASQLRGLGVLGAKRIPESYLLAGVDQRRELMRGLIDSDGYVSKAGQVEFTSTSAALADGFRRLAWSLGRPCYLDEDRAILDGRDCGPRFRLVVACDASHGLVSLSRKAKRMKSVSTTTGHRRIVAIEAVESRPVRCVQVDADDHLYLAGEALIPTHNTTLLAGVALYHGDYTPDASVLLAASSRDQCGLLLGQAEGFVRRSPGFDLRFRCYDGYRKIDCLRTGGEIQVFAADDRTGDGVIPTLALLDELHRHKSMKLYRTWRGKLDKRGGQLVTISTAGEPGSEFEKTRERARTEAASITTSRNGRHIRAASEDMILHDYGLRPGDDHTDLDAVKDANPFSGITKERLARKLRAVTMTIGHWLRFVCDVATRVQAAAVGEAEWAAAEAPGPALGQRCDTVGLDVGWKWDCTALAPWFEVEDGLLLGESVIITPPRDGNSLDPRRIQEAFESLHAAHPIGRVAMDMTDANEIAHWLERELGVEVVDVSQKAPSKAACAGSFLKGLRTRRTWHVHDPEMTRHVMNAVTENLTDGSVKFIRPRASRTVSDEEQDRRVIDGLDAAAMGHFIAASGRATYDGPLFEILT